MSRIIIKLVNLYILNLAYKILTIVFLYKSIILLSCILILSSFNNLLIFTDFIIYKIIFKFVYNFIIKVDFYKDFN